MLARRDINCMILGINDDQVKQFVKYFTCEQKLNNKTHFEHCENCYSEIWGVCPICVDNQDADMSYKYSSRGNINNLCDKHNTPYLTRFVILQTLIKQNKLVLYTKNGTKLIV